MTYRLRPDDDHVIIANPCKPDRLDFTAFRKRVTGGRRPITKFETVYRGFYIPDTWKHNLHAKLQDWIEARRTQVKSTSRRGRL